MMKKPVLINTDSIRPSNSNNLACEHCLENTARWQVGLHPSSYNSCSFCLIYRTSWGRENEAHIHELAIEVGVSIGMSIFDGHRISPEHSDRIMSSIVALSSISRHG